MFKKYKNDIYLCLIIAIILVLIITIINISNNDTKSLRAEVWLMGNKIDDIDLSLVNDLETKAYRFDYYDDEVEIKLEFKQNMIRVVSSDCPNKICVDTGWSDSINKPIICMEYGFKVILKDSLNDYDIVVG